MPTYTEIERGPQCLYTHPEHGAHGEIEVIGESAHPTDTRRKFVAMGAVLIPPTQVRVTGKHQAKVLVSFEGSHDPVHHRMHATKQVLPEELAPRVSPGIAQDVIAYVRVTFAMQVCDQVVAIHFL